MTEGFFGHDDDTIVNSYRTIDGLLQRNLSDGYLYASPSPNDVMMIDNNGTGTGGGGIGGINNAAGMPDFGYGGMGECLNYYENISYLNISCETILSYSVPLYGYCTPFLLLTTVTANTLIVLVLNKRNMATPTNLVLMGEYQIELNIFDCFFICGSF